MRGLFVAVVVSGLSVGPALAHEGRITDLKAVSSDHQVETVRYCEAKYEVKLKDGSVRVLREFDLRIKTDSGPKGPRAGTPVLIEAGMAGDRAFLVFSRPDEIGGFIKAGC